MLYKFREKSKEAFRINFRGFNFRVYPYTRPVLATVIYKRRRANPDDVIAHGAVRVHVHAPSLVPRPFGGGEKKTAWYTLNAHASKCTENPGTS